MVSSSDLQVTPNESLIDEPLCWASVLPPKSLIARYAVWRSFRTIPASGFCFISYMVIELLSVVLCRLVE